MGFGKKSSSWITLFSLLLALLIGNIFKTEDAEAYSTDCSINSGTYCKATFSFTGSMEAFIVPSGVTEIVLELAGAQGGSGSSSGGKGGYVSGTLSVTSGATIYVYVGGQNGWNGGGTRGTSTGSATRNSASGGGASDIRISGTTLSDRKVVAGGGGGAGRGDCSFQAGGGGGYPGGLGGTGGTTLSGGNGGTNGGGVSGGGGGTSCTSSARGGGGGGQNGGGGAGGYGTSTGGSSGQCGSTNDNPAGGELLSGATTACFGVGGNGGSSNNGAGGGGGGGWYGGGAGGGNWGSGGGGGSSYLGTMTSTSYTNANQSGNGYVTITYLNSPTPTTFSTSQATPTNASTSSSISYSLVFSQSVTGLAADDFQYAAGGASCNTPTVNGSGNSYTVTVTNCSEGLLTLQLKANSVTGTSVGPPSISSANAITIDRTAPTISSVTAPSNGTYSPTGLPTGSALTFSLVMSESVTVTTSGGTPSLSLTIGSVTRNASYLSQSDSRTLTFRYTLTTSLDEIDTDGIALSSTLALNGGVIADLATNALTNTSLTAAQALPSLTSVLVAQRASAPTITGIDAGNTQLSINFTAGSGNGSAISNYKYSLNGGAFTAFSPVDTTSPLVITGLTNGTSYAVRILAITAVGDGDSSTAVSATPTAIVVAGGSNITATYGESATSLAFTASGGSSPYTFSLSPSISGISIDASTGVVTTSTSLSAGSYTTFVIATDSASRSGQKAISVTISADTPTITIALTGGVTSTPLAASVAIIATVSEEGSVNFQLGGVSISGCSAVATSSGSASCSWTPAALGSATLTAILTPTDNTNYIAATSPSLAITVVTGTSAITLTLSTSTPTKGQTSTITATTTDIAGIVAFRLNGKLIKGCKSKAVSSALATCSWKVSRHGEQTLSARFTPTNNAYNGSAAQVRVVGLRRISRT